MMPVDQVKEQQAHQTRIQLWKQDAASKTVNMYVETTAITIDIKTDNNVKYQYRGYDSIESASGNHDERRIDSSRAL